MSAIYEAEKYSLTVTRAEPPGAGYRATFSDIPFCVAHGATQIEAVEHGYRALAIWIERAHQAGVKLPEPGSQKRRSGRTKIRAPFFLHQALTRLAKEQDISLNVAVNIQLQEEVSRLCGSADLLLVNNPKRVAWIQRMDDGLLQQLSICANSQGVSGNTLILCLLAQSLVRQGKP